MGIVSIPRGLDENLVRVLRELSDQLERVQNVTSKFSIESDDRGRPRIYVNTPDGKASIGATVEHKSNQNELDRVLNGKKNDIINVRKIKCDEIEVSNDSIGIGTGRVHFDEQYAYVDTAHGVERISTYRTYWDDLKFPVQAINPIGPVGAPAWDSTHVGLLFDGGGAAESVQIIAQLPHSYKEGSDLYPHLHWENTSTSTNNVRWLLEYRWRNNEETAGAFTSVAINPKPVAVANQLMLTGFGAISKADALISSILDIKLSRTSDHEDDTNTSDMRLKEFDIHYQVDSEGSRQELIK